MEGFYLVSIEVIHVPPVENRMRHVSMVQGESAIPQGGHRKTAYLAMISSVFLGVRNIG
jgi:hypothetical protein